MYIYNTRYYLISLDNTHNLRKKIKVYMFIVPTFKYIYFQSSVLRVNILKFLIWPPLATLNVKASAVLISYIGVEPRQEKGQYTQTSHH